MALCIYCGNDFGAASSVICLHCDAPLIVSKKRVEPDYRNTKTRLSHNGRRILEMLDCFPAGVPAPGAKTIASALGIDWGEVHLLLERLHEDGMVVFTVDQEQGMQYFITPRGKVFL